MNLSKRIARRYDQILAPDYNHDIAVVACGFFPLCRTAEQPCLHVFRLKRNELKEFGRGSISPLTVQNFTASEAINAR